MHWASQLYIVHGGGAISNEEEALNRIPGAKFWLTF